MKAYVISDTHFNHDKIAGYCNRPSNHEAMLLQSMMGIKNTDLLIHLGDVCIGENEKWHQEINDMTCRKVLVMGNHDSKSWSWYMEHGWDFVCDDGGGNCRFGVPTSIEYRRQINL